MSKAKRKRYTGAFKAKVGLEALKGIKTVGQIAREYEIRKRYRGCGLCGALPTGRLGG